MFHIKPWEAVAVTKLSSSWPITWQPCLKLTNCEGEEGARHSPSLAPRVLEVVYVPSSITHSQQRSRAPWNGIWAGKVLNESETTSTTLTDPQSTEITSGENYKCPCFHCQVLGGTWCPEIFTKAQHGPGLCLTCRTWAQERPSCWWTWQVKVQYSLERPSFFS